MAHPISRADAVASLEQGCEELASLVAELSAEVARSGKLGGGEWSVRDLIGHIETWERAALETLEDLDAGRPARIDETVTDVHSMDAFNAREVSRRSSLSLEEAMQQHRQVHSQLVRAIEALPDEDWGRAFQEADGTSRTLGEKLGSITGSKGRPFGHVYAHLDDLKGLLASVSPGAPSTPPQ